MNTSIQNIKTKSYQQQCTQNFSNLINAKWWLKFQNFYSSSLYLKVKNLKSTNSINEEVLKCYTSNVF